MLNCNWMAQIPPEQGPPPQYVAYPRGPGVYGTPEKLRAVAAGYFGLNYVFGINVALVMVSRVVQIAVIRGDDPVESIGIIIGTLAVTGAAAGACSYPYLKKIGFGCGWAAYWAPLTAVFIGLQAWLCCGAIGYVVVQQIAAQELKKYGLKTGFGGIKKKEVERVAASMESTPPTFPGY